MLIQDCLSRISAEADARRRAVVAASGLIAEAEALMESIKQHMPEFPSASVNVYEYGRDIAEVVIYVWGNHVEFFGALKKLNIECIDSSPIEMDILGIRRTFVLSGFDVRVVMENEILQLEAA